MSGPLPLTPSPLAERGDRKVDLYVVAERSIFNSDIAWLTAIEAVLGTNDRGLAVQIRTKSENAERSRALAIEARRITSGSRVPVFLNGTSEDAVALGYEGVHWPEGVTPPPSPLPVYGEGGLQGIGGPVPGRGQRGPAGIGGPVSGFGKGRPEWISASVHSADAARRAGAAGAHFLVAGTIFDAGSKDAVGQGIEHLRVIAHATALPVLAIGGVTAGRVEACIEAGAYGVAVVSAVLKAPDMFAAVRDLREALDAARAKAGVRR